MAPTFGTARMLIAAVVAVLVAAVGLPVAVAGGASAITRVVPGANPDLAVSCGLDVVLVLDASNSINTAGAAGQVRSAANNFLASFRDTNTRVGIVTFNTTAVSAVPLTYDTTASTTGAGVHAAAVAAYAPGGRTNWQDALIKAKAQFDSASPRNAPKLLVFVTDGAPNSYNSGAGTVDTTDADPIAIDPAVTVMNQLKYAGVHSLAVGIGQALTSSQQTVFRDALRRVSEFAGAQVYPDTAFDAQTTDLILQADVSALRDDLRAVADQVCDGSLSITQYVTSADAPNTYRAGGSGWAFSTSVTPVGDWVKPLVASGSTLVATTTSGGTALAQWNPGTLDWTKAATVTGVARTNYVTDRISCTVNDNAIVAPALVSNTFTVGVGAGKAVACAVYSKYTGPLTTRLPLAASKSTVVYGGSSTLSSTVASPNGPLKYAKVTVQSRVSGASTWSNVAVVTTNSLGKFTRVVKPTKNRQYRALFAGSATQMPATSSVRTVKVAPKVTIGLSKSTVAFGKSVTFSGSVAPKLTGKKVSLQRWIGGKWVSVKSATLSSTSKYAIKWTPKSKKDYNFRVYVAASTSYASGRSSSKKLTVK